MKERIDRVFMVVLFVMIGNCMKQVQLFPDSTMQVEKCIRLSHMQPPFVWNCKPKTTMKLSFCDNRKTFARYRKKNTNRIFSFGLHVFILLSNRTAMDFFGQNIREFRLKRCLSQEYMAFSLGIHTSNYSRLESGTHRARMERVIEIAKILQVQPYELFLDKKLRIRLEEAKLNEMRLQQLELELSVYRIAFAAMPESFQTMHRLQTNPPVATCARNFVS